MFFQLIIVLFLIGLSCTIPSSKEIQDIEKDTAECERQCTLIEDQLTLLKKRKEELECYKNVAKISIATAKIMKYRLKYLGNGSHSPPEATPEQNDQFKKKVITQLNASLSYDEFCLKLDNVNQILHDYAPRFKRVCRNIDEDKLDRVPPEFYDQFSPHIENILHVVNVISRAQDEPTPPTPASKHKPSGVTYTIGGVKVEFPTKAYPSQVSMMDKIIRGCHRAQNCLLESPTGSGKTLALLCGALAWQKAEASRVEEIYKKEMAEYEVKEREMKQKFDSAVHKLQQQKRQPASEPKPETTEDCTNEKDSPRTEIVDVEIVASVANDEDEDVFFVYPSSKKIKTEGVSFSHSPLEVANGGPQIENVIIDEKIDKRLDGLAKPKPPKVPKIYFGTRTHKQIAQVVHELRKTVYSDVSTTILSSRTHSCIMIDKYNQYKSKNDLCNDLLDPAKGMGCKYKNNVKMYYSLMSHDIPTVWDLEDLIQFGKRRTVCPYFTARELMASASVVFCPYNYLIDPLIRRSLDISLKGDILILDEAHNIEDTCRDAASFSVDQRQIQEALQNCEEVMELVKDRQPFYVMIRTFRSLSLWIDQHKNDVNEMSDYDQGKLTLFGPEAVQSFNDFDFNKHDIVQFETALRQIEAEKAENENTTTISGTTKNISEGLILIFTLLYNPTYTYDYHVVLTKSFSHHHNEEPPADGDGWFNRRKKPKQVSEWQYSLHLWCLNPATIFFGIKEKARSVILTSGTLSPMDSFQSELGVMFPITLEANHVIDASQCWVGSLGSGPNYVKLDGTYKSTSTYQFQDEVGALLLNVCSFVPHGVLCFVPSYSLLDKLRERWDFIALTEKIERHKVIMWEPRRADQLENLLAHFYRTIEETANNEAGRGVTGVLFLAVCRGKVSEGLDFADKNARIVVTIGIPFPNVKDSQVMLKKSYNDKHQHSKGLLNGRDWYQIQAYRALNQALGRCIRHRHDWGAILLVDSRFSSDGYYKGLSKWVRNKVRHHGQFNEMIGQLSSFIRNRLQIEKEANPKMEI